ncbi:hypothetical protein TNCV_2493881 [Trichonephila clavipes]|uniref:Uncharacterized protein n=1 Tax=Trichonephila clavipes TaxID=2585209 RepID=A0A8X6S275_TRICX|nr:hypothetical protein TNCV_2493881 [Trichonephila clavipes]
MKFFLVLIVVCLIATAVFAADCPETPCKHGKVCVREQGSNFCVHPAAKDKACSDESKKNGVYENQPPCDDGLTCDTSLTVIFRSNMHLEITEKKHQPTRAFCDGFINLKKQIACVKRKAETGQASRKKQWRG